jgi:hypothetical protein
LISAAGHNLTIITRLKSVSGSLRERSPGVWQVRVSLGRDPKTHRYRYAHATVHGGRRAAQREAARLVKEANDGKIPFGRETLAGCSSGGWTTSRPGDEPRRPCSRTDAWLLSSPRSSARRTSESCVDEISTGSTTDCAGGAFRRPACGVITRFSRPL